MSYKVSAKAKLDLIRIWEYTLEHWSLQQADSYYRMIVDKFDAIGLNPHSGRSYEDLRKGYRGVPVKSHIIFYKLSSINTVEIIRILHQRMDYHNVL